jgi:actin-related protein
LVGGSTKFPGFVDELEEKLIEHLPRIMQDIELVDVLDPKESDHSFLSWKGASIVAQCESFKGCIVTKQDWSNYGIAILKARAPFHF